MFRSPLSTSLRPALFVWRRCAGVRGVSSLHFLHSRSLHLPGSAWTATSHSGRALSSLQSSQPALHSGLRWLSTSDGSVPNPNSAYSWVDAEAEQLIARAYGRHKALADRSQSFPPSLSVQELERIGVPYSKPPADFIDRLSFGLMKALRVFVHGFFREKYDHHAVCLETVAAVPGMVAAFHRHMRSLRRMSRDNGWIGMLSEEAENERMHLLIFLKVTQPSALERGLVLVAQGAYLSFYSVLYFTAPRAAHRLTGYLEEEAHRAYTDYLRCIDNGSIANKPAPEIARQYYRLTEDATMRDVVLHVRADEACHRDVNHHLADMHRDGNIDSPPTRMGESVAPDVEFRLDLPIKEEKREA